MAANRAVIYSVIDINYINKQLSKCISLHTVINKYIILSEQVSQLPRLYKMAYDSRASSEAKEPPTGAEKT